jgi:ADP-heptose:LPS heptosyltransferase
MENILVIKLRSIGDTIIATPVFRILKKNFNCRLIFLTSPQSAEIVRYNPYIDKIIHYDKNNILKNVKVFYYLLFSKFDIVINLHASFHSALLAKFTFSKKIIVNNHSGKDYFSTLKIDAKKEQKSAIDRDLDALKPLNIKTYDKETEIFLLEAHENFAKEYIEKNKLYPYVGINPGARRKTKMWDIEKYAIVCDWIAKNYNMKIVIITKEEECAQKLIKYAKTKMYYPNGLNILQAAALIKHCSIFIGNDSATHHIAAAFKVPSITIFGPESPIEWHPYNNKRHIAISKMVECINCGLDECNNLKCIKLISTDEVISAVKELLH